MVSDGGRASPRPRGSRRDARRAARASGVGELLAAPPRAGGGRRGARARTPTSRCAPRCAPRAPTSTLFAAAFDAVFGGARAEPTRDPLEALGRDRADGAAARRRARRRRRGRRPRARRPSRPPGATRSCCATRTSRATRTPSARLARRLLARLARRGPHAAAAAARAPTRRRRERARPARHAARLAAPRRRVRRAPLPRAGRAPAPARARLRRLGLDGALRADAAPVRAGRVAARARVEAFVFGTRLTRVTRELAGPRPRPRAARAPPTRSRTGRAARASAPRSPSSTACTAGASAAARSSSCSPTAGTAASRSSWREEMARLRRCAHRLVWLNPLAADPRYEPLTRGMQAALPHVDRLLPGNSIALAGAARRADGGRRHPPA